MKVVCIHPLIPLRSHPDHRSDQVSQLLFGETADVKDQKGEWSAITTDFDGYSGWVEKRSLTAADRNDKTSKIVSRPLITIFKAEQTIYIPAGSEIPPPDMDGRFVLGNTTFSVQDNFQTTETSDKANLITTSRLFLNAPYLWGGRTVFGMDCSGFVQIVFKINHIPVPRDTKDQAKKGTDVPGLQHIQPGDLLFFQNKGKEISHVGISIGQGKVIHASTSVRIDFVDNKGIYNAELKTYTHELEG
ncbi:MAG: C40 family peptidase, partial [Bacteroidales bacterium]